MRIGHFDIDDKQRKPAQRTAKRVSSAKARHSQPAVVETWSSNRDLLEEIRRAYAEASPQDPMFRYGSQCQGAWYSHDPEQVRNLHFLASDPVSASELYNYTKYIGSYNRFRPKIASNKITAVDPAARVWVGREYSVVLYIAPTTSARAAALYTALKDYGDEVGFVKEMASGGRGDSEYQTGDVLRVWWD